MSDDDRAIIDAGRGHLLTGPHSAAQPYSKETQLSRGPRKYRRKVASPKQWQALTAEKCQECRVCREPAHRTVFVPGRGYCPVHHFTDPHHLIPRDWHGDDVADNIVGLCRGCHDGVELREPAHCRLMLTRLSDAEYAYAVQKVGEGWAERVYGIEYER